jgi:hypothetical protein
MLIIKPGSSRDPLVCRLKHISSLLEEQYDALSYAWGPGKSVVPIEIASEPLLGFTGIERTSRVLKVTPHLEAALRRLRLPDQQRVVWIDAICINQSDLREKAIQVPIMRDIYTNAHQVIIWLGEEAERDQLALEVFDWLSKHFSFLDNILVHQADGLTAEQYLSQVKEKSKNRLEHLATLLRRKWFNRTWVLQEVACAQNAVLMCGNKTLPWDIVPSVLSRLQDPTFALDELGIDISQRSKESIFAMDNARRCVNGTKSLPLFHLILATCLNECKDPRDKIYGVMGLAKDWLEKGGLIPDYRRVTSAEEVYKRFAMWDVKTNGTIRILSCATSDPESSGMASWTPDWRNMENEYPFVRYSDRTTFRAAKSTSVDAWYSDHGKVLNTVGKVVDSVRSIGAEPQFARVTSAFPRNKIELEQVKGTQKWLQSCQDHAADNGIRPLTQERYDQFWRTMTCNLTAEGFPAPAEWGDHFDKYLKFINLVARNWPGTGKHEDEEGKTTKFVTDFNIENSDLKMHSLIESSIERWSSKRRFCTTTRGRLACLPRGAKEDDLICVLYGGEVPYVLRPQQPGFYTVVGECYVNGIMHGEALSTKNLQVTHFKLI